MTLLELRDKLNELPPEVLDRPAIAVYRDERTTIFHDYNITELTIGRICRKNTYKEFAEIKLQPKTLIDYGREINES